MSLIDFRRKDIIWTASDYNNGVAYREFPYIELVEYEQTFSATIAYADVFFLRLKDRHDTYKGLYLGKATNNSYILPFFSPEHHNINQDWQDSSNGPLGTPMQNLVTFAENAAKMYFPAASMIAPKSYGGGGEYTYEIKFYLLNTVGDPNDTIPKNKLFIEKFIRQNLHAQHNPLTITPPCLYEVYIPGIRWSPVAVVSNLTINNIGTLNKIDLIPSFLGNAPRPASNNFIVPDAYEVIIQIRELIRESRSIFDNAIVGTDAQTAGGKMTVKVIQEEGPVSRLLNRN